ncbi:MAG: family 10 glycosylhydrolase [Lachnospiraceae bacterium]|nr:family 10 glycosylhydrolase [Lachnospiraceae bacterium]
MNMKHFKRFLSLFVFSIITIFTLSSGKDMPASAASLHISAEYEKEKLTNSLEVKLSIDSSSELTMLKYAYARVPKSIYFTINERKGTAITKNEKGEYSFFIKKNGYVSVIAINKAGEEALLVFKVTNIDTEAPEISISAVEETGTGSYSVDIKATDDMSDNISVRYVQGAYASPTDKVWKKAEEFFNQKELSLEEGKYTFLVTDEAGNTYVTIRRFGKSDETDKEFRAVWIAYLEFKSTGYTKEEFQTHIETMFNEVCAMNMNAVVVHVRPFGDAMYRSDYFPWSRYVSGVQGKDPGFDPLEIMVEEAHARGLEFHAWINPYRITSSSTNVLDLSIDNPARIYRTDNSTKNDRNVLAYGGKLYYNPASPKVQTLLVNGIKEIVKNYDVDGIHFDDYFYPALGKNFTTNFDAPEYESYKKKQIAKGKSYMTIADWRRENVNTLIRNIYAAIKEINPNTVFGISPGGFIDALKADDKYYVDFETWLGHDGYIDYLCPQLYWSNQHSIYPFNDLLDRFIAAAKNPDVKLYVGIPAYKAGIKTEGTDWYKNSNVLSDMIRYSRNTNNVDGFILFSYNYLISKRNFSAIRNLMLEFK